MTHPLTHQKCASGCYPTGKPWWKASPQTEYRYGVLAHAAEKGKLTLFDTTMSELLESRLGADWHKRMAYIEAVEAVMHIGRYMKLRRQLLKNYHAKHQCQMMLPGLAG